MLPTPKSLTIGIPVFNESANISVLLNNLISIQKYPDFDLKKIIVISDGSTDRTVSVVKSIRSPLIDLVDSPERLGISCRLNQMLKMTDTDVLIILNGDILPVSDDSLNSLAKPIIQNDADLSSGRIVPLPPQNFVSSALYAASLFKDDVYSSLNHGNNIYTCRGTARAFSSRFYSVLKFPGSAAEDAFSYLYCRKLKLKYKYVHISEFYYQLPSNLKDHFRQSLRYLSSKNSLDKFFTHTMVTDAYFLPSQLVYSSFLKNILAHPLGLSFYFLIYFFSRIKNYFAPMPDTAVWSAAASTKKLTKTF
ncbi:MAG TPA: glycosyltransferase [Patescibacteria group bacterium]